MIEKLKETAHKLMDVYKNNKNEYKKYRIISDILEKDDCFINMSIEYAYSILRDLQIPEEKLHDIYMELIDIPIKKK